ncbi:copper chaperone for superoxide dismutase [Aplysia californica]|uniref:Superoxide dismutase copper chaperone n=1 Tax=Aplysia californica TaxID=6500 RepID=A0ABM0K660_APLCA|nr:copper chaperone for superoxide dismutase [Aplysia californica]
MESTNSVSEMKTQMEFAVEMNSPCCVEKVKNAIKSFAGLNVLSIDLPAQRVVIEGDVVAEVVKDAIEEKTGLSTVVLGQGSEENLGAGIAAVSVGSSGVRGLLRWVQNKSNTCVIEGTLDSLPASKPIFLSVHECGDLSNGCENCGSLLTTDQGFNGVLSRLSPNDNQRAEFRVSTSDIKLSDVIGRCVVVHQGDQEEVLQGKSNRLACGIVARASGLFQNSKRFCACDGVTIWEQKNAERSGKL